MIVIAGKDSNVFVYCSIEDIGTNGGKFSFASFKNNTDTNRYFIII